MSTTNTTTVQFYGETPWDTIVHHKGLDLEEEESFRAFVSREGNPAIATLEILEELYEEWVGFPAEDSPNIG